MGLLRYLLILVLIIYVFYKGSRFLYRLVFGELRNDPRNFQGRQPNYSRKAPDSNLNIDNVPRQGSNSNSGYEGGEYVDYEEVK